MECLEEDADILADTDEAVQIVAAESVSFQSPKPVDIDLAAEQVAECDTMDYAESLKVVLLRTYLLLREGMVCSPHSIRLILGELVTFSLCIFQVCDW